MKKERDYTIKSIKQADEVLRAIADAREPMGLSEVVKTTGLKQDAVFRLLSTMEGLKWLTRVGDKYELGMGISVIWARYTSRLLGERDAIDRTLKQLGAEG